MPPPRPPPNMGFGDRRSRINREVLGTLGPSEVSGTAGPSIENLCGPRSIALDTAVFVVCHATAVAGFAETRVRHRGLRKGGREVVGSVAVSGPVERVRGRMTVRMTSAAASASAASSSGRTLGPPTETAKRSSAHAAISATTPAAGHTTHRPMNSGPNITRAGAPSAPAIAPNPTARRRTKIDPLVIPASSPPPYLVLPPSPPPPMADWRPGCGRRSSAPPGEPGETPPPRPPPNAHRGWRGAWR